MKTAVIYARYSCDKQNDQSIEGQLRVCNDYAERNDIVILDSYIDRATSGTNDNRPKFQRMLKDSDKRKWNYVLVYKLDRFSRNKYEMATHKKHLKDNGIKVLSAMENIPDTPEGIILESLLEGMAEYFSAELSQKILRGLHESRSKGYWTGGTPPYGYKNVNKRLVIDEEQARVVRYIYEQASSGVLIADIIKELHDMGIMYHGRLIAKNTVYNILRSERYVGVLHIHNETYTNIFPRIIDDETFQVVRTRLEANRHNGKNSDFEQFFKGKLYCGYCRKPLVIDSGTGKDKVVRKYYACSTRKSRKKCDASSTKKELLENYLLEAVNKTFSTKENIRTIAEIVVDLHQKKTKEHSALNNLLKEKSKTEFAISNLMSAMEQGIITTSTKTRLAELETQLEDLTAKIIKEETSLEKNLSVEEVIKQVKNALKKGNKEMIFLLVDKIYVYKSKIEIYYNFKKIKDSGDKSQSFLLYKGKSKMQFYHIKKLCYSEKTINLYVYYNC